MSLDLIAAVEAARMSDAVLRAQTVGDVVDAAVTAAAPVIEAQVRAQAAADIEARRDNYGWNNTEAGCFTIAARIARGESS